MLELFIPPAFENNSDPFKQWVEDFLSWEWSQCDFEAHCLQRLHESWKEIGLTINIILGEEEDHILAETFGKLFLNNKKRVDSLIKRHSKLITQEALNEENDKEFRSIWPKLDWIIKVCCKTIDRICKRTLKEIENQQQT